MHSCRRTDFLFPSKGITSKLPPAVEWKGVVLEQLGSVRIYLFKMSWMAQPPCLCKICKPCAKLRLVQTTKEVKELPSARRASLPDLCFV